MSDGLTRRGFLVAGAATGLALSAVADETPGTRQAFGSGARLVRSAGLRNAEVELSDAGSRAPSQSA